MFKINLQEETQPIPASPTGNVPTPPINEVPTSPTNQTPSGPVLTPPTQPTFSTPPTLITEPTGLDSGSVQPTDLPKIENAFPNVNEVRNLKRLAFGRRGELTSLISLLSSSADFKMNQTAQNTFNVIAEQNLLIYKSLLNAIVDFGGKTNLTDGIGNVWSGRNVISSENLTDTILGYINLFQNQIRCYECAQRQTQNLSLINLFNSIISLKNGQIADLTELLRSI